MTGDRLMVSRPSASNVQERQQVVRKPVVITPSPDPCKIVSSPGIYPEEHIHSTQLCNREHVTFINLELTRFPESQIQGTADPPAPNDQPLSRLGPGDVTAD